MEEEFASRTTEFSSLENSLIFGTGVLLGAIPTIGAFYSNPEEFGLGALFASTSAILGGIVSYWGSDVIGSRKIVEYVASPLSLALGGCTAGVFLAGSQGTGEMKTVVYAGLATAAVTKIVSRIASEYGMESHFASERETRNPSPTTQALKKMIPVATLTALALIGGRYVGHSQIGQSTPETSSSYVP